MSGPFDPSAPTPEMSINVSLGEFHSTHNAAYVARDLIAKGMDKLSTEELNVVLFRLMAGQRLTEAETGNDSAFASDYWDDIKLVQAELKARKKSA